MARSMKAAIAAMNRAAAKKMAAMSPEQREAMRVAAIDEMMRAQAAASAPAERPATREERELMAIDLGDYRANLD